MKISRLNEGLERIFFGLGWTLQFSETSVSLTLVPGPVARSVRAPGMWAVASSILESDNILS